MCITQLAVLHGVTAQKLWFELQEPQKNFTSVPFFILLKHGPCLPCVTQSAPLVGGVCMTLHDWCVLFNWQTISFQCWPKDNQWASTIASYCAAEVGCGYKPKQTLFMTARHVSHSLFSAQITSLCKLSNLTGIQLEWFSNDCCYRANHKHNN